MQTPSTSQLLPNACVWLQLPLNLAQAVVDFVPTVPTATDSASLQEALLRACLLFVMALPKSVETDIKVSLQCLLM